MERGIENTNILYLCDGHACSSCTKNQNCNGYTHKIKHAKNFMNKNGTYYEKERNIETYLNVIDNLNDYIERLKDKKQSV